MPDFVSKMKLEDLQIYRQIEAEVSDPLYQDYVHGSWAGHNAGCRGPLCKKWRRLTSPKSADGLAIFEDYMLYRKMVNQNEVEERRESRSATYHHWDSAVGE